MKKRKELLWFLLPYLLLPLLSLLVSALTSIQLENIGASLALVLGLFFSVDMLLALLQSGIANLISGVVFGIVVGGIVLLLRRWIPLSRRWWYVAVFAVTMLFYLVFYAVMMRMFPTVYVWFLSAQLGNIAAFFVWLVELIWTAVKKPKQEVETE